MITKETVVLLILYGSLTAIACIFSYTAGFNRNSELLTSSEIADNIELVVFNREYPYMKTLGSMKIDDMRSLYRSYNMEGTPKSSRTLVEALGKRICYTRLNDKNFNDPVIVDSEVVGNVDLYVSCMLEGVEQ